MKKISLFLVGFCLLTGSNIQAQAFEKGDKLMSVGLGGAYTIHAYGGGKYYPSWFSTPTGNFTFQAEFAVHDYVGVGFTAGIGGGTGWGGGFGRSSVYTGYYGAEPEITVPVTAIANFHFYQLIQDKTKAKMHADKLDVYAGVNLGSGMAYFFNSNTITPLIVVGPQVGARYYFKPNLAVHVEVGYGKTFVNAGLTFRPGK